jgi:hypothetical protein
LSGPVPGGAGGLLISVAHHRLVREAMARFLSTLFRLHDIVVNNTNNTFVMTIAVNTSSNESDLELLTTRTTAELVLGTLTYIVIIFM